MGITAHLPHKICIVGAGIMGLQAAYTLRAAGHNITLYDEAGFPPQNASFMAGGMLAPWSEIEHLPPSFINAALEGLKIWKTFGTSVDFHQNGSLLIAHKKDEHMLERFAQKLGGAHPWSRVNDLTALEPSLAGRFENSLYITDEAHINPQQAMQALGKDLDIKVETADIKTLSNQYDHVIDCRGMSAQNNDPDLRGVKGETLVVRNHEFKLTRPLRLMHPRYPLYIVPRGDGIFMIGATLIESEDSNVTLKSAMELMSALYSLHPSFSEAQIIEIRAGVRPAYPDNLPRMTIQNNIIRCNGLFRHGYLLSPIMAQCVNDYLDNKQNQYMSLFMRKNDDHLDQRQEEKHRRRA